MTSQLGLERSRSGARANIGRELDYSTAHDSAADRRWRAFGVPGPSQGHKRLTRPRRLRPGGSRLSLPDTPSDSGGAAEIEVFRVNVKGLVALTAAGPLSAGEAPRPQGLEQRELGCSPHRRVRRLPATPYGLIARSQNTCASIPSSRCSRG